MDIIEKRISRLENNHSWIIKKIYFVYFLLLLITVGFVIAVLILDSAIEKLSVLP